MKKCVNKDCGQWLDEYEKLCPYCGCSQKMVYKEWKPEMSIDGHMHGNSIDH